METIYIDLTRPKNRRFPVFSWAIRFVQAWRDNFRRWKLTPFSHTIVRWEWSPIVMRYEAAGMDTHFIGHDIWESSTKNKVHIVNSFEFDLSRESKKSILQKLARKAKTRYPLAEILGILIVIIWKKLTDRTIHNPFGSGDALIKCSEVVALIQGELEFELGIKFNRRLDQDSADVLHVHDLCDEMALRVPNRVKKVVY